MIDSKTPLSIGWWLSRLATELLSRRERYNTLQSYVDNTSELRHFEVARSTAQAYQRLRRLSKTNFAELLVEAPRERMVPAAFRTGRSGNSDTDAEAWRIWQANSLDADSAIVHRTSLTMGDAYVIVGDVDDYIGAPTITIEDPREVIAKHDPIVRRKPIAALKLYRDDMTGQDTAYLYLPGRVHKAVRGRGNNSMPISAFFDSEWSFTGEVTSIEHEIVPVVRFVNKPGLRAVGSGEFEAHLPLLDRINYQILQRLEIATLQAFRQRAIKGVPDTDADGNTIDYSDIFAASPGSLWLLPETADIWESGQVDLNPIRSAIRDDVQDLAAVTRTPLYYLTPEATNGSAEGASLAREGLVYKAEDRQKQAGESWERVISTAFLMSGDTERAALSDTQVLWSATERFSLAERYDAAVKASSAGVPWRTIMIDILQFSPQDVDRMEADRFTDSLLAGLSEPVEPVPVENAPVVDNGV